MLIWSQLARYVPSLSHCMYIAVRITPTLHTLPVGPEVVRFYCGTVGTYVDGDSTAIISLQVHGRIGNSVTGFNILRNENYLIFTSAYGKVSWQELLYGKKYLGSKILWIDQTCFSK